MASRILLIEDDPVLGAQVMDHLRGAGHSPSWQKDAPFAPEEACGFSLVILDLMLPGAYGLDLLRQLRQISDVPVLVLSARSAPHEVSRALSLGADDYVVKPFWPDEFVQRVAARLRRPSLARTRSLAIGEITVDLERRTVLRLGAPVELTRSEFDLLAALVSREGEPLTRDHLATHVLEIDGAASSRSIDVHVSHLRRKLGNPRLIETIWGIGYRFRRLAVESERAAG